ncbi:MAG: adenylate/guanylate cyclase domain-containing protein, partial [Bauldia sp.]|nr:adenylate/guanylate cyclase domain-containing protein [Bauldia sp.]
MKRRISPSMRRRRLAVGVARHGRRSAIARPAPMAHAGIHAGPLIERDGDFYGHTVNLAARIVNAADADRVDSSEEYSYPLSPGGRYVIDEAFCRAASVSSTV